MENKQDPNTKKLAGTEKRNTSNRILIIIIAFLTIACGILLWQFLEQRKATQTEVVEKTEVVEEKDALTQELENMLQQYEMLQTDNTTLQEEIETQKNKIEELLADVTRYKGQASLMGKYKRETVTLRAIMQNYVSTIDSLNTLNQMLNQENMEVKQELSSQQSRYQELNQEKEALTGKVRQASQLKALQPSSDGVFYRSGGKEVETNRYKKAEKIRVCFTLSENKIAQPGNKPVYVRIISPSGKILAEGADESNMFEFDGVRGLYSTAKIVKYNNQLQTVCTYYTVSANELTAGDYTVDIYTDGTKIGSTVLEMK